jgi:uncharacterized cupredoxin-like copper-binding protein
MTRMITLAAALGLTLAACASSGGSTAAGGHEGHGAAPPPAVEGAPQTAVTAKAFAYEPATLTLKPGQPLNIALTSTDMLHDFTIDGQDFHLSADPDKTTTGALTIAQPGTYIVYCTVPGHREAGMEATLTVAAT